MMTKAHDFIDKAIRATAELKGISFEEAGKKVKEIFESKTGLSSNGSLFPPFGVCLAEDDEDVCEIGFTCNITPLECTTSDV